MGDWFGLWKFWEKLIDVSARGVWGIYNDYKEPKRLVEKWKIEADNRKQMIIAEAEWYSEALKIKAYTDLEIRAFWRLNFQESKKQERIENIVNWASKMNEWEVSDEDVSDDWITRFFNIAWEISSEKAQLIWSKILSWEIKQPGSYSLRTLEIIRNISISEAETFNNITWFISNWNILLKLEWTYSKISEISGIPFKDILILEEAWLMSAKDLEITYNNTSKNTYLFQLNFKNKVIYWKTDKQKITLPCFKLNKAWMDVLNLIWPLVNESYFEELKKYLISLWCTLEIIDI